MLSFDTNLLFAAVERSHSDHDGARDFLEGLPKDGVAISELVLTELYVLLRNPAICVRALGAADAVALVQTLRTNPAWRLLDVPENLMDRVWKLAAKDGFARRRIYDARLAVSLVQQGVVEFATRNVADFQGFGFRRVFDPLAQA